MTPAELSEINHMVRLINGTPHDSHRWRMLLILKDLIQREEDRLAQTETKAKRKSKAKGSSA